MRKRRWTRYVHTVKLNWNIEFPVFLCKERYSIDSGSGFHGDGTRYHILQYSDAEDILEIVDWADKEGKNRHGRVPS